ncbi:hypothetical protein KKC13_10130 [bacterium]|nr:hypothetical protein [bacterium]MBU1958361.1 hypothetical protein [bacterium]
MFNNKAEEEADFCEAYKSQILNVNKDEKSSTFSSVIKIITILILLAIIVAVSIYSYNYFTNAGKMDDDVVPPVSVQTLDDDELKVTLEDEAPNKVDKKEAKIEELDIDKIANDVKVAIAQKEEKESNKSTDKEVKKEIEPLKVPTGDVQSAYIEELAKLTEELDKERE